MKTKQSILILILALLTFSAVAVEYKKSSKQEFEIPKSVKNSQVYIKNVFGSVNITTYKGDKLILEIDKTITGKVQEDIDLALKETSIRTEELSDGLFIYYDTPCTMVDLEKRKVRYDCNDEHGWSSPSYKVVTNLVVKVPENIDLFASTVNKGDVIVDGIRGNVNAHNVNGSVSVTNQIGNLKATTVNGDVDVSFNEDPSEYGYFKTINGDINVHCSKRLDAEVEYESMNGHFYTNYSNIEVLPAKVDKTSKITSKGTIYKLSANKHFKIGNGKIKFSFDTINGDMILKNTD